MEGQQEVADAPLPLSKPPLHSLPSPSHDSPSPPQQAQLDTVPTHPALQLNSLTDLTDSDVAPRSHFTRSRLPKKEVFEVAAAPQVEVVQSRRPSSAQKVVRMEVDDPGESQWAVLFSRGVVHGRAPSQILSGAEINASLQRLLKLLQRPPPPLHPTQPSPSLRSSPTRPVRPPTKPTPPRTTTPTVSPNLPALSPSPPVPASATSARATTLTPSTTPPARALRSAGGEEG